MEMLLGLELNFSAATANSAINKTGKRLSMLSEVAKLSMSSLDGVGNKIGQSIGGIGDVINDLSFTPLTKSALGFGNEVTNAMHDASGAADKYYDNLYNKLSSTKGIGGANAQTAALTSMASKVKDAEITMKSYSDMMGSVGVSTLNAADIQSELTKASLNNTYAFNKFNDSLNNTKDGFLGLKDGMSEKQLGAYTSKFDELQVGIAAGEISILDAGIAMDKLNKKVEFSNKTLPQLAKSFASLGSGAKMSFIGALGLARVLDDAIKSQADSVNAVHQLALKNDATFKNGAKGMDTFAGSVKAVNNSIVDIAGETAVSLVEANGAFNALAQTRFRGSIQEFEEMSVKSIQMQQSFGLAEGAIADTIKTLSLAGGIDTKGISNIFDELAKTQASLGMTQSEATEATAAIVSMTSKMARGGKITSKNAGLIGKSVSKMTVTFTRAGLAASDATAMLDRFLDPDKLEDNAYLWHKMGISVADGLAMMSGDPAALEQMSGKMGKVAYDLQQQWKGNPLVLNEMSKAMGMTMAQVNQLGDAYKKDINLTTAQIDAREKEVTLEKQAAQARESAAGSIKKLGNAGNALMAGFVVPLLDAITPILIGIGNMATKFNKLANSMGKAGDVMQAFGGFGLIAILSLGGGLLKLLSPMGKVKDIAMKMFSAITSGGKGAADAVSKSAESIADIAKSQGASLAETAVDSGKESVVESVQGKATDGIKKVVKGKGAAGDVTDSVVDKAAPVAKGPGKLAKAIKGIPAKELMQIGAAMALLAASVLLLAVAFKVLVGVIKTSTGPEIAAGMGLLVGMMGLMIGAMYALIPAAKALGEAGKTSAPGIIALGAALLMVAASVAIIVLSMAVLMKSMENLSGGQIAGGIAVLVISLAALIGMAYLMAASAVPMGIGAAALLALGVALVVAASAAVVFGLGVILIAKGIGMLIETISSLGANFVTNSAMMASGIAIMTPALLALGAIGITSAVGILILAVALGKMSKNINKAAPGMATLAVDMASFISTLEYINTNADSIMQGFDILVLGLAGVGKVAKEYKKDLKELGKSLKNMGNAGQGIILAGNGISLMATAISKLTADEVNITTAFTAIQEGLAGIGGTALLYAVPIASLSSSFKKLSKSGAGLIEAGNGLNSISTALATMAENPESMGKVFTALETGINQIAPVAKKANVSLLLLGVALNGIAKAGKGIMMIGNGLKLIGESITKVSANPEATNTAFTNLQEGIDKVGVSSATHKKSIQALAVALVGVGMVGKKLTSAGTGLTAIATAVTELSKSKADIGPTLADISTGIASVGESGKSAKGTFKSLAKSFMRLSQSSAGIKELGLGLTDLSKAVVDIAKEATNVKSGFDAIELGTNAVGESALAHSGNIRSLAKSLIKMGKSSKGLEVVGSALTAISTGIDKAIVSMDSIGEKFATFITKLSSLGTAAKDNNKDIASLAASLILLGASGSTIGEVSAGLTEFSTASEGLETASTSIGTAFESLGSSLTTFVASSSGVGEALNELTKSTFKLGLASLVFNSMGKSFMSMGKGMAALSNNITGIGGKLLTLKTAMKDIASTTSSFDKSIEEINKSFGKLSVDAQTNIQQTVSSVATVTPVEPVGQAEMRKDVTAIKDNTGKMVTLLEKIAAKNGSGGNAPKAEFNPEINWGAVK